MRALPFLLLLLAACGTSLQFMPLAKPPRPLHPRPADEVEIVTRRPLRPAVEVALVEGQQASSISVHEAKDVLRRMRVRAGEEGCDALLLLGSNDASSVSVGPFGGSVDTLRGYRASCLVYSD